MKLPWPKYKRGVDSNEGKRGLQEFEVLDNKQRDELKTLLDERDEHLDEAFNLDMKIIAVEESTKTLIPAMVPVHNYLRMRFKWYYNWHTKPYARKVHWTILSVSLSAMILGMFFSIYVPSPTQRTVGAAGCTTTGTGTGLWSDVDTWTGCNNTPPRFDDVTITNNVTIDTTVWIAGSLTISNGATLNTTGTPDIYVSEFINSGGTFTPGNSTVYLPCSADGLTLTSGNITFNNLTTWGIGGFDSNLAINIGSGVLTINGNLTLTTPARSGAPTYTLTYTMGNNITVTGTTTITKVGTNAASKLDTKSGSNYTLTTGALSIEAGATLVANISTINVVNSWTNAGTFTCGTSTVNFTGTATNNTINSGGSDFNNLTINSSNGNGAWSPLTNQLYIANDLTMTAGTFNTANGTADVRVFGNAIGTSGIIDMTAGTNSFWMTGRKNFGINNVTWKFYALRIFSGITSAQGSGEIWVTNQLSFPMAGQLYGGNRTWRMMGGAGLLALSSSNFIPETSTVSYEMTNGGGITSGNYYNLQISPPSGTPTYSLTPQSVGGGELCLLPNTMISIPNGDTKVSDLKIGDSVWSYDFVTKQKVISTVSKINKNSSDNYYEINNKIKATFDHVFYLSDGTLKEVKDLRVGDSLLTDNGDEIINTINIINEASDVYDVSLNGVHNYYADGYLVHNTNSNGTITVQNNLTMVGGGGNATLTGLSMTGTQAPDLTVIGNVTIGTGQTITANNGSDGAPFAFTVKGNWSSSGTFNPSTGTVTLAGTSGTQTIDTGGTGAGKKFYNMTINNSGSSVQLVNNDMTMNTSGNITMTAGTLDLNGRTLTLATSLTTAAGTIAIGSGTLSGTSYNLTVNSGGTITQTTGIANFTNISIASGGTYTCNGNSNINLSGNWSRSGTFTPSSSTVTFNGSGTQTITGTNTWNNITVNNTAANPFSNPVDPSSAQTVSGTLLLTDGEYRANTGDILGDVTISAAGVYMEDGNSSITFSGNLTLNGGSYNSNGSTTTFTGAGKSIGGSSTYIQFITQFVVNAGASLTINIASTDISAPITANGTLIIGSSTTVISPENITIGASGLIDGTNVATSALNVGLPTITLGGTNNFGPNLHLTFDVSSSNATLSNLDGVPYGAGKVTVYSSAIAGTRTVTPAAGTMHFNGDFELNELKGISSTTLDFNNSNNTAITFGGSFTRTETNGGVAKYTKGASDAITFDGAGTHTFDPGDDSTFNNITYSGSGTLALAGDLDIAGDLSINNGTFNADNNTIYVNGDWNHSGGTFTAGATQTVQIVGSEDAIITGNTTFNNLQINTSTTSKVVKFESGSTQTITGTLNIGGLENKVLTLGRSGGSGSEQYNFIIPANMTSGDYITVSNNKVNNQITPGDNVTDGGNNTNWMFPVDATPTPTTTATSSVLSVTSPKIGLVTLPGTPVEIEIALPEPETGEPVITEIIGDVSIKNVFGKTIENIQINESEKEAIVANNNKNVVLWNNPWWRIGLFKAEVKVVKDGKDVKNTVNFIVIPLWIWIFLALTLAFEIYRTMYMMKNQIHPNDKYTKLIREDEDK